VNLPLDGVRIIDMSSVVMGPFATQLLADLGADVIAIEDRRGDTNRSMGAGPHPQLSGVSLNLLRNKRSIGLDVRTDAGYEVLGRLVATADVFVTNLRPGSRHRARITRDHLGAFRPDLVYCAASGYAADDDRADAPAYDDVIQAGSGFPELFERIGLPPVLAPTLVADKTVGLMIANVVLAGLFDRERTGEGADISLAMVDVMRSFVLAEHGAEAVPEPQLGRPGYPRILNPNRRPQPTADGLISVLPYERHHYEEIFRHGGRDDLLDDPRLESRRTRIANGASLYRDVAEIIITRTTSEWVEIGRAAGIPMSALASLDDLLDGLPLAEHPHAGRYRVTPPMTGAAPTADTVRRPAPLQGEHNREVLVELGYGGSEIDALEAADVLYTG
jgi:crotonobetainyl-CoA:carnitine CoA-transferase CaiB-like acyl-CoA transferase